MNKTTLGVLLLIVLAIGGGYYLWSKDARDEKMMDADTEAAASGPVIDSSGSVEETRDLEAELNATGADTDEDMRRMEAEFEAGA